MLKNLTLLHITIWSKWPLFCRYFQMHIWERKVFVFWFTFPWCFFPRVTFILSHYITATSQWARWRLESPAPRLFDQPFVQAQIKESFKAPYHWPLWGESTVGFLPKTRKIFPFDDVILTRTNYNQTHWLLYPLSGLNKLINIVYIPIHNWVI